MRTRAGLVLVGLLAVVLALPTTAAGQEQAPLDVTVRDSTFAADGAVELIVNVTGEARPPVLEADGFQVTENGDAVEGVAVEPLLERADSDVGATLLLDVSGSMAGEPMTATRRAAADLVRQLTTEGITVGLISFGDEVVELSPHTDDTGALVDLIGQMEPGGETPLYDGVVAGAEQLADVDGQRNLIVFSDGGDTSSSASLHQAIGAAQGADAPIVAVAFETEELDDDALDEMAASTDGRVLTAAQSDAIAGLFDEVAADLASQYVLTYTSDLADPQELDVRVGVATGDAEADITFTVPNPREPAEAGPPEVTTRAPSPPGILAGPAALVVGLGAAFVAVLLVLGILFTSPRSRGDRVLGEQLARYLEAGDRRAGRSGLVASHFRERAMAMLESSSMPEGIDERLSLRLEQAAWPLRNGEFLALTVLAGLGTGVATGLVFNWLGGFLLALIAAAVPWLILETRRSRRRDAFLQQLPDTLQLLAGSLRAGYAVLQAIDSVAKEAPSPTAEELQRVVTEARLGMPIEDALEAMGVRIGSDEFRWVVLAINIQREVGGNLAELLDTVAETLREREALRRQIKVLSAEGRLSAVILIALPIVLTIYLVLVRPTYIATLVTSGPFGWLMVIGASVLMGVGVLWIRKMVQIEV